VISYLILLADSEFELGMDYKGLFFLAKAFPICMFSVQFVVELEAITFRQSCIMRNLCNVDGGYLP
jgi:hypothetical protein